MITKTEAIESLKMDMGKGKTVYSVVRHVSASGQTRHVSLLISTIDGIRDISHLAAIAMGRKVNVGNHRGIQFGGVGLNAGYALTYALGLTLFNDDRALRHQEL